MFIIIYDIYICVNEIKTTNEHISTQPLISKYVSIY